MDNFGANIDDFENDGTTNLHKKMVNQSSTDKTPQYGRMSMEDFKKEFQKYRLKTIAYCFAYFSFGMCISCIGVSLVQLECHLQSLPNQISWVFFSQALFTLVGSSAGGVISQRFGNHKSLLISLFILAFTLIGVPSCRTVLSLSITVSVMGFFMGTIDTVANVSILQTYGRNVAPFLQALHFFYSLGAVVSLLIVSISLRNSHCTIIIDKETEALKDMDKVEFLEVGSGIEYGFWTLAALQVPVILLLYYVGSGDTMDDIELKGEFNVIEMSVKDGEVLRTYGTMANRQDRFTPSRNQIIRITACTGAILFVYDGLQAGFGSYGYYFGYAMNPDKFEFEKWQYQTYLIGCYWGTFALGRLLSIYIATKLMPTLMLLCSIIGCFVAMTFMLLCSSSWKALYIGTSLFGIFLSSVYPTAISVAEMFIDVTPSVTSALVASAALGEMLLPVMIGHEFINFGPISLLVNGVVMTFLSFGLYFGLLMFGEKLICQPSNNVFQRLKALCTFNKKPLVEDTGPMKHHVKQYRRMRSDLSEVSVEDALPNLGLGEKTPV